MAVRHRLPASPRESRGLDAGPFGPSRDDRPWVIFAGDSRHKLPIEVRSQKAHRDLLDTRRVRELGNLNWLQRRARALTDLYNSKSRTLRRRLELLGG